MNSQTSCKPSIADVRQAGVLELDLDIDRALDELRRSFPGLCMWHGEFSGSLWALLPDRLVEAKTAADLARQALRHSGPSSTPARASSQHAVHPQTGRHLERPGSRSCSSYDVPSSLSPAGALGDRRPSRSQNVRVARAAGLIAGMWDAHGRCAQGGGRYPDGLRLVARQGGPLLLHQLQAAFCLASLVETCASSARRCFGMTSSIVRSAVNSALKNTEARATSTAAWSTSPSLFRTSQSDT